MIRVLLVHDVGLLRCALAALVGGAPDMTIQATPWREALRSGLPCAAGDVCVVDADSTDTTALRQLATCRGPERPACGLLALVTQGRPGALRRALDAKAQGFVGKDAAPELLLTGIRQVARGERFVDDSLAGTLLRASEAPLTRRELSVLAEMAEGASIAEIARRLCLSAGTVRNYISAITRKTGARNRVDAVRISQGAGWV
ncbi:response regulator transcription factor [Streptomyces sp. ODS28]|uniref:response regulator transcription factor n=1 Tax=Streptomyces sp. ODS28 TaxID=3136688 RepID=UPI0031EE2636